MKARAMPALLAATLAVALAFAAPAAAQGGGAGLDRAVDRIAQQTGGRVLSAETVTRADGRRVHRIRVLVSEGRVRVFEVPADSRR